MPTSKGRRSLTRCWGHMSISEPVTAIRSRRGFVPELPLPPFGVTKGSHECGREVLQRLLGSPFQKGLLLQAPPIVQGQHLLKMARFKF